MFICLNCYRHRHERSRNRVRNYVAEVVPRYSPDEFRLHFRMSRTTVEAVYGTLAEVISVNNISGLTERIHGGGREQVTVFLSLFLF